MTARLKIGELAQKAGKTVRALRLYEELDLLRPVERTSGGMRLYGPNEIARVSWIGKLQDMGFSLAQIQQLLSDVEASKTAPAAMHNVHELFRARLQDTRDQVVKLLQLERDLTESLAYLEGCQTCTEAAAIHACVHCDVDHAERHRGRAPTLVAGLHLYSSLLSS